MNFRARFNACVAVAGLCLFPISVAQAQSAQNPPSSSPQTQSQMQQALAAAQPGPQHAQLMKLAGDYTTKETFYAPGSEPQESTGTAKLRAILGGRFVEEENSGQSFGQAYSGLRLYGYNNGSKQYEAIWIYDGSTAILVLDGTSEDNGKTVRYSGAFLGPTGEKQTLRVNITQNDADHFTVKLLGESAGGMSTLETVYTRVRKSAPAPRSRN
jgi:uncharacterized protein DUF1579